MSTKTDLELSLLIDVSGSVDNNEYVLQVGGYATAFENGDLYNSLISQGVEGSVAVNFIVWASAPQEVIEWTLINSVESSQAFAQTIRQTLLPEFGGRRPFSGGTSPGPAIDFATNLMLNNDFDGRRLSMDVSGDGTGGVAATLQARDNALAAGVDVINGIVIGGSSSVLNFYQNSLIGGTNADGTPAFAGVANSFTEFGSTLDQQLIAELTPPARVSIEGVSLAEGSGGNTEFVFNVRLSKANDQPVSVSYATADGTAVAGLDYTAASGTVTFNPGEKLKTVSIPVAADDAVELDETFSVNLSNIVNADLLPRDSQGIATIVNDDETRLSNSNIDENSPTGTEIGQLDAGDPAIPETFTYSLLNDSFGRFVINGDRLQVADGSALNFEASSSYNITVRATDSLGNNFDKDFLVTLNNVNEPPTNIFLSNTRIDEKSAAGTVLGNLTASDPDFGETQTYTLVDDAGGRFQVVGGELQVANGSLLDANVNTSHDIILKTTDAGGLTVEKPITITVNPINEPPTNISISNSSVDENSANDTTVGSLTATDPDPGETHTFTLLDNAGGRFVLAGDELKVANGALLDIETNPSHNVTIRATDPVGLTLDKTLTINVNNVNETPPTDIELTSSDIDENSADGTAVGSLTTTDADVGDNHTYTLIDDAGGRFAIAGNTLQVANGTLLDAETTANHNVTIQTTDEGGLTFEKTLTVTVNNVNEAPPTDIQLSNNSIDENTANGEVIGVLTTTDADVEDSHTYQLTDNAEGRFSVVGSELQVADSSLLDANAAATHDVTLQVTDAGGLTFDKTIAVTVNKVNEAPTDIELSNASVDENSASATVVGDLSTTDPDSGDTHTYTLVDDAGGRFAIAENRLVVADGSQLDFETDSSHNVVVKTTDAAGEEYSESLAIALNDIEETEPTTDAPTLTVEIAEDRINEAGDGNTAAATVTRNGPTDQPLTVSLTGSDGTQLTVPGTVTIPANEASASFEVAAVDDEAINGDRELRVTATSAGFNGGSDRVTVVDNEGLELTVNLAESQVSEGAGSPATTGTVTRNSVADADLEVVLESSDEGVVGVPTRVLIPANQDSVTFPVTAVDDDAQDGTQTATISAFPTTALGDRLEAGSGSATIEVTDNDGPTLTLETDASLISETGATSATVSRNGATDGPLVVNLTSSDSGEATVPATVQIPANEASATFEIGGVDDGEADGGQAVDITAGADGFNSGATRVEVHDADGGAPDLVVTEVTSDDGLSEESSTITYRVENKGTATAEGTWVDAVYLSADDSAGDDGFLSEFQFSGNLPPGRFYERTVPFELPSEPGEYRVVAIADEDGQIDEGGGVGESNNTTVSAPIQIDPAYYATVSTEVETGIAGNPISFTGQALSVADNSPVPFEFVKVEVAVNGTTRQLDALTDENGNYEVEFQPLPGEAGRYEINATHPNNFLEDEEAEDRFTLLGMDFGSDEVFDEIVPGIAFEGQVELENLADVALSGINAIVEGAPADWTVAVDVAPDLSASGTSEVKYTITAPSGAALGVDAIDIRLESAEGATASLPVNVKVQPSTPLLVADTETLKRGMLRGEQTPVEVEITNEGGAATGDVEVLLPDVPWLSLASSENISSLEPGESTTMTLLLNPAADLPLVPYEGSIVLDGAGTEADLAVPFEFRAISDALGDLEVSVVDEFTFYTEAQPKVAGAEISLIDPATQQPVVEMVTDATGMALFEDIREGQYILQVESDEHGTYRAPYTITPGFVGEEEVFIPRETVSLNWTVVPTEIEDEYRIELQSVFETNVPAPVVTIDNPVIMPLVIPGRTTQVEVSVTNHGLIAANDVELQFPEDDRYIIEPLIDKVDVLAAKSSLKIPVLIRLREDVASELSTQAGSSGEASGSTAKIVGECKKGKVVYNYVCGDDRRWHVRDVEYKPVTVTEDCAWESLNGFGKESFKSILNLGRDAGLQSLLENGDLLKTFSNFLSSLKAGGAGALINSFIDCSELDDCEKATAKALVNTIAGGLSGGILGAGLGLGFSLGDIWNNCCWEVPVNDPVSEPGFGSGSGIVPYAAAVGYHIETLGCTPGDTFSSSATEMLSQSSGQHLVPLNGEGDDGVCARVRIQIDQEAVMTRSAFEATLEIENGDDDTPIEDISVNLEILDTDGNPVMDRFGIPLPELEGLTAVDGSGIINPGATGSAEWTLIPGENAAPEEAARYSVGGTFTYTENGETVTLPLFPAPITVLPQAELHLDYFQQREVYGDDPFTDEEEPAVPFSLGLLIRNEGKGDANDLKITSAQPKIIENEKGLLVDFEIIGTQIGTESVSPSLTAEFGDIEAGGSAVANWLLESSLQGKFIEYEASFEHISDLNLPELSLIKQTNIHELIKTVRATIPSDDDLPDFLVNGIADENFYPDTLYLSDGTTAPVNVVTDATADGAATLGDLEVQIDATLPAGWNYIRLNDPANGNLEIDKVLRPDGSEVLVDGNVWRTDRTFPEKGRPIYEDILHLFDYQETAGAASYTITYKTDDAEGPEVTEIVEITPNPRLTSLAAVEIEFSEPIQTSSFDAADIQLTKDGGDNLIAGDLTILQLNDTTYRIAGLETLTGSDGEYQLTVNATAINDLIGNSGTGSASESWVKAENGLAVAAIDGISGELQSAPVDNLEVTFSQPIDAATFDFSDISLTKDGASNLINNTVTVTAVSDTKYTISGLASLTGESGEYELAVNATAINDTDGNIGIGSKSVEWTLDSSELTMTAISEVIGGTPRNTAVDGLEVTFNKLLDLSTFSSADLILANNDGENLITDAVTIEPPDADEETEFTYRIVGIDGLQTQEGTYTLTVSGDEVRDEAGNAASNSLSQTWELDLTAPAAPTDVTISPDLETSGTGSANTTKVVVAGTIAEEGLTVSLRDLTGNSDLGEATVTGTAFEKAITLESPGNHEIEIALTDAAGNKTTSEISTFADLSVPTVTEILNLPDTPTDETIESVDVVFSEAIVTDSFDYTDISLTRDGGENLITDAVTVSEIAEATYRIEGLAGFTAAPGDYELTVDTTTLQDLAGNSGELLATQTFSVVENIAPGIDINQFDGAIEVVEGGETDSYSIVLTAQPTADVTISIQTDGQTTVGDELATDGEATATETTITFTSDDWNLPQIVSVAAVDDGEVEEERTSTITHAVTSDDPNYSAIEVADIAVTVSEAPDEENAEISGTKWHDINGDGVRDADEPGLEGWTIYIDANNNGELDADEISTETDAEGNYSFTGLAAGTYTVAEVIQDGWQQTFPGKSAIIASLTTTGAQVPIYTPDAEITTPSTGLSAIETNSAYSLINLDKFRSDPRFADIDGSGFATVIIDTGIDTDHPFFDSRLVYEYDFAENDGDASEIDGHGSHVASIIASSDETYPGVAPGADIIALKAFKDNGDGYFADLEKSLRWVIENADTYNIASVNLSIGDDGNWTTAASRFGLGDELSALAAMDILVVAAAGNNFGKFDSRPGLAYPAADANVLAVGAVWADDFGGPWTLSQGGTDNTTKADQIASFSQRHETLLDVLAPGVPVTGANTTGGITAMGGTSQAAGYVSGAAVLAQDLAERELGRRLSVDELREVFADSGAVVNDGDDEDDNVANTGLDFPRVDMVAIAESISALSSEVPPETDGSDDGDDSEESPETPEAEDGETEDGPIVTADGEEEEEAAALTHTVELEAGETVTGIDFGNTEIEGFVPGVSEEGDKEANNLEGGAGNDTLSGRRGSDTLKGGAGNDILDGGAGKDELLGNKGNDTLAGGGGADLLKGGEGDDVYQLDAKNAKGSKISDTDGKDTLELKGANLSTKGLAEGKAGYAREGNNLIIDINKDGKITPEDDLVIENFFTEEGYNKGSGFMETVGNLSGSEILDNIGPIKTGTNKNDVLRGGDGDDTLSGKGGRDRVIGNGGNDLLKGGNGKDIVKGNQGNDKLRGGRGNDRLHAGFGNDKVQSGRGNDTLIAGGGADILKGAKGNDTYQLNANNANGSRILDTDGEDILELKGSAISLDGLAKGTTGFKRILNGLVIDIDRDGKATPDKDLTIVKFFTTNKNEAGTGFLETVDDFKGEDILKALEGEPIPLIKIGNEKNNSLKGGAADDLLKGEAGRDRLVGRQGNDTLAGGKGRDNLKGGRGDDLLLGQDGSDTLIAGGGVDVLKGGRGNDTYQLNANNAGGSQILDTDGKDILKLQQTTISLDDLAKDITGFQRVLNNLVIDINQDGKATAKGDLTIANFFATNKNEAGTGFIETVDNLKGKDILKALEGEPIPLIKTGNEKNNSLKGGAVDDLLKGKAGRDRLIGRQGNDTLAGGEGRDNLTGGRGDDLLLGQNGSDTLIAGGGVDLLKGGNGNDTYQLKTKNASGSQILDTDGTDTLKLQGATISKTGLAKDTTGFLRVFNNLVIDINQDGKATAKDDLTIAKFFTTNKNEAGIGFIETVGNLTGKEILTTLEGEPIPLIKTGNEKNNSLNGGAVDDLLKGEAGSDRLFGRNGNDTLAGGEDGDNLQGDKGNDLLLGQDGNDTIDGGSDADILKGGAGNDTLTGGQGRDRFVFDTGSEYSQEVIGKDAIADFLVGEKDKIVLDTTTFTQLSRSQDFSEQFAIVTSNNAAATSDAYIVYNSNNGRLFYNPNRSKAGLGDGGQFATLDGAPELDANDFLIQA